MSAVWLPWHIGAGIGTHHGADGASREALEKAGEVQDRPRLVVGRPRASARGREARRSSRLEALRDVSNRQEMGEEAEELATLRKSRGGDVGSSWIGKGRVESIRQVPCGDSKGSSGTGGVGSPS